MTTVRYAEGDWFAVPLGEDGFAVGVVARANPKAALLGYFFGPRHTRVPALTDVASLKADDALLVGRFSHLGLIRGDWAIVGAVEAWDRREWPMPVFRRYEELTGRTLKVFYDADDPARIIGEERVAPSDATHLPKDGLMGVGFVELRLSALLV